MLLQLWIVAISEGCISTYNMRVNGRTYTILVYELSET
jgi:hypothetical protein